MLAIRGATFLKAVAFEGSDNIAANVSKLTDLLHPLGPDFQKLVLQPRLHHLARLRRTYLQDGLGRFSKWGEMRRRYIPAVSELGLPKVDALLVRLRVTGLSDTGKVDAVASAALMPWETDPKNEET